MNRAPPASSICRVLEEDHDLAEAVPDAERDHATKGCLARVLLVPVGRWVSAEDPSLPNEGIGLLVLNGLLLRRVGINTQFGAELLGEGDLLRPWQGEGEPATIRVTTGWQVLEETRIAILDEAFARRMAQHPQLASRLIGRALQRSRNLTVNMAIVHQARVDIRLHMLLWYLAGRWGRVRSDCVLLPLRLTHSFLSDLVAARRPTVTSALSDLSRRELVKPTDDGWLLCGEPPGELMELSPVPADLTTAKARNATTVRSLTSSVVSRRAVS